MEEKKLIDLAKEFSFNYPSEVFHRIENEELRIRLIHELEDAYCTGYNDCIKMMHIC